MRRCRWSGPGSVSEISRAKRLDRSFDDDRKGTGIVDGLGVTADLGGFLVVAAERAVAARGVDELRHQADMAEHRNAALGEEIDGFGHFRAALELDGAAAGFLEDAGGAVERPAPSIPDRSRTAGRRRRRPSPSRA